MPRLENAIGANYSWHVGWSQNTICNLVGSLSQLCPRHRTATLHSLVREANCVQHCATTNRDVKSDLLSNVRTPSKPPALCQANGHLAWPDAWQIEDLSLSLSLSL